METYVFVSPTRPLHTLFQNILLTLQLSNPSLQFDCGHLHPNGFATSVQASQEVLQYLETINICIAAANTELMAYVATSTLSTAQEMFFDLKNRLN